MPPEGTDLVLSSDVPNGEGDVLVLDSLDVETWRDVSLSISFAAFLRRDAATLYTLLSQAEHPSVTQEPNPTRRCPGLGGKVSCAQCRRVPLKARVRGRLPMVGMVVTISPSLSL